MPDLRLAVIVAFIGFVLLQTWLGARLYDALRAREPDRYEPPYDWAERVQGRPSSLFGEVVRTTRFRLGTIGHRSPYPEVERLRRLTLVALALTLTAFLTLPLT